MVRVRPFRDADAAPIRAMMQRLAEQRRESSHHLVLRGQFERFFPKYLHGLLESPDSVVRVAEDDAGAVVGYAIATRGREAPYFKYQQVAKVTDIFVDESHRGHGVGHELLGAIEAWATKSKLDALEVDVFPEHQQEIGALEGLGFVPFRMKLLRPLAGPARKAPAA